MNCSLSCFGDSCRIRFMKLLAKLDEEHELRPRCVTCSIEGCFLGWLFQDLTHLHTLDKPRSPLSPWGSWRQACLCVLWPCVPCPLDPWNTFSELISFALLFAALQLWYRAFASKAFQKVANDFPVYNVYFSVLPTVCVWSNQQKSIS